MQRWEEDVLKPALEIVESFIQVLGSWALTGSLLCALQGPSLGTVCAWSRAGCSHAQPWHFLAPVDLLSQLNIFPNAQCCTW